MKYGLRIKGEHCFLNRRHFMFGELVCAQPVDWFEVLDGYDEGEFLPIDRLSIWLEEYKDDLDTPSKVVKLIDNGKMCGSIASRNEDNIQCREELPTLYRYSVSGSEGFAELRNVDHFEEAKFEVRIQTIEYPGRGRVKTVSGLAYDGEVVSIVDSQDGEALSWLCRYGDNGFWIKGDVSVPAILAGLGYGIRNVASADEDGYSYVGCDHADKSALYLCKSDALPDSDGFYPCHVKGFPDAVSRLSTGEYNDSEFAVAVSRYNPVSGEMD